MRKHAAVVLSTGCSITFQAHSPSLFALTASWYHYGPLVAPFTLLPQETQPHKPEAVAVTGNPVGPSHFSKDITLDDVAASLRLEQGEVAAALIKARDSLQEQARLQQQKEAKQAAAAAAAEAAERAKPKVGCNIAQLTSVSQTPSESNSCCTIRSTRLAACACNISCKASINVSGKQLTCSDTKLCNPEKEHLVAWQKTRMPLHCRALSWS